MPGKNISCTYQDLIDSSNRDSPIEVIGEHIIVTVENLKKGTFYVAPLYFWSQGTRPIRVEILKPGSKKVLSKREVVSKRDFTINRNLTDEGKDQWTKKRYKLDRSRHNGKATFRIGWPAEEKVTAKSSFKLIAAPLTSKTLVKQQRVNLGQCPQCGKPGEWISMAMMCKEHGRFLG
jgi:hypothetical protein